MRDKLVVAVSVLPYVVRLVALVLILNGMFALVVSATVLIGSRAELDWRIFNIAIGFGLVSRHPVWHIAALTSIFVSAVLHVKSLVMILSAHQVFGAAGVVYFAVAIFIDLAMLSVLLQPRTLDVYFGSKRKS